MAAGVLIAVPAIAQQETMFEEIVVTTRKKEENLQDIPISVNALSREDMERAGIKEFEPDRQPRLQPAVRQGFFAGRHTPGDPRFGPNAWASQRRDTCGWYRYFQ